MKKTTKIKMLFLCLLVFHGAYSQVTIGLTEQPAEGALLQLKNIGNANVGERNSDKGLLMPRVYLEDITTLAPFNTTNRLGHTGLLVYNLNEAIGLKRGIAVWNGEAWNFVKNDGGNNSTLYPVIKTSMYNATLPNSSKYIHIGDLKVWMQPTIKYSGQDPTYKAMPYFNLDPNNLQGIETKTYHFHYSQYNKNPYPTNVEYNFSNDIIATKFYRPDIGTNYRPFVDDSLSPDERNEVWMIDNSDNVYHFHFFTMGDTEENNNRMYTIIGEKF